MIDIQLAFSETIMKFREATHADSRWILHHRIGMFTDMGLDRDYIYETARLTEQYLEDDWTNGYRYFLVEEEGEVIAGCGISPFRVPPQVSQKTGFYAYLSNMFVEQEHRRKGVGKALLRYVINVCRNDGIGLLFLHASDEGLPLYESEGFVSLKQLMHRRTWE
ncbi:MAG: GNAT family N-acetyltransferase [Candidatus Thorarchaeota archaeon]